MILHIENKAEEIMIPVESAKVKGNLVVPEKAQGVVLFAHGSGSSRFSPRNQYVAQILNQNNFATLLLDLLTRAEGILEQQTRHLRFDIGLLSSRLIMATQWLRENPLTQNLNIGYFGASTGSAAALVAAAEQPKIIRAIVSRGGRPDLAGSAISRIKAPTLLIVGENDPQVIQINQQALAHLHGTKQIEIIAGATHLFEEEGTLEEVAALASQWFTQYLIAPKTATLEV